MFDGGTLIANQFPHNGIHIERCADGILHRLKKRGVLNVSERSDLYIWICGEPVSSNSRIEGIEAVAQSLDQDRIVEY